MTELVLHLPLPPPLSALTKNVDRVGRPKTKRYNAWISLAYFRPFCHLFMFAALGG